MQADNGASLSSQPGSHISNLNEPTSQPTNQPSADRQRDRDHQQVPRPSIPSPFSHPPSILSVCVRPTREENGGDHLITLKSLRPLGHPPAG
mmetsp:Transcript_47491/g.118677  ORF Transcript_47491/g.118677 Transcript_47491/m.118677 type:complete len:92 (-) Transcript_47491:633-908(-)